MLTNSLTTYITYFTTHALTHLPTHVEASPELTAVMQISTRQGKGPKEEITKPKSPKARWAAAKLMMLPRFQVVSSSALDVPSLYGPRPHLHLTPCPPPSASPSCTLPTLHRLRARRGERRKRLRSGSRAVCLTSCAREVSRTAVRRRLFSLHSAHSPPGQRRIKLGQGRREGIYS